MQPSSESKTQAAPASLAEVPADAVAVVAGRFCVVTATSASYDRFSELLAMQSVSALMAELEKVRINAPEKYGPLLESCVAQVNAALAKAQREKGLAPSV